MTNKHIDGWIRLTLFVLVLIVGAEVGFIFYIRHQNEARQAQIRETAAEIAYEDSVNRANMANRPKSETVEDHFNRHSTEDPLDAYIDQMVEQEIRAMEQEADDEDEEGDETEAVEENADATLDEEEDWGEEVDTLSI